MKKLTTVLFAVATLLTTSQSLLADNNFIGGNLNIPINTLPLPNGVRPTVNIPQPDLVIPVFRRNGNANISGSRIVVPVRIRIQNQGQTTTGRFKLSADYKEAGTRRAFHVALSYRGRKQYLNQGFVRSGQNSTFSAKLVFPSSMTGKRVSVVAKIDSCAGDEFMRPHCRVKESNEGNNLSRPFTLTLPR